MQIYDSIRLEPTRREPQESRSNIRKSKMSNKRRYQLCGGFINAAAHFQFSEHELEDDVTSQQFYKNSSARLQPRGWCWDLIVGII